MNNCYIYYLYDKEGIIKYVGQGRRDRFKNTRNRNKEYLDILNDGGKVEKVIENLSTLEAVKLEALDVKIGDVLIVD
jgi:hypothetical protein